MRESLSNVTLLDLHPGFDFATGEVVFVERSTQRVVSDLGSVLSDRTPPTSHSTAAEENYDGTATAFSRKSIAGEIMAGRKDDSRKRTALRELCDQVVSAATMSRLRPGMRILNLGCGRGQDYAPFESVRASIHSGVWVDISGESLRVSMERAGPLRDKITYIRGDMRSRDLYTRPEFVHGTPFDLVVSTLALHYALGGMSQTQDTLANIASVCAPRAVLVFTCMYDTFLDSLFVKCKGEQATQAACAKGPVVWNDPSGFARIVFTEVSGSRCLRVRVTIGTSVVEVEEPVVRSDVIRSAATASGWNVKAVRPLGEMYAVYELERTS